MNKTLIAMAVAGVMAAPMTAMADATVYGKIHVSIDSGDDGQDSALYWQSNSSRIGFKGSEDLGGGLSAIWQLESNMEVGSGSTSWGLRNTFVGLKGGWGTVLGGRHDTPMKTVARKFDLFGDQVGDSRNVIGGKGAGSDVGFDLRTANTVAYLSPTFGPGLSFQAAYVIEDGVDTKEDAVSASGYWKAGNFLVGLGYETHGEGWNTAGTETETGMRVGVKWTPGGFIVSGFYETLTDLNGVSGADADTMGVGVGFKMGKNVFKVQYYMVGDDGATDADAATMAIGWDHNLSKRTTAYIAYAATDNDNNASYAADASGHGGEVGVAGPGQDPSVISFGMIHKF